MRGHVLRLEKHVMFEYNLKIYIYVCVMYLLWQFRNMSLYMREYVCVKAWTSAEGCIWEKKSEYGKCTSCVK